MIKRIHVNQHKIRSNAKTGSLEPVITVKTSRSNTYGHEVEFQGGRVVYSPYQPLSCGAKLWIETKDPVTVVNKVTGEKVELV